MTVRPARKRPMLGGGRTFAPEDLDVPPPGFEEIQRQELSVLFRRFVGVRVVFLPVAAAVAAFIALRDPARWRVAFLVALVVPVSVFVVSEAIRVRRVGFTQRAVSLNLLAAVAAMLGVALATGGLESPFVYAFVPLAVMIGLFTSGRAQGLLVALEVAGVAGLSAIEIAGVVPDLTAFAFAGGRGGHDRAYVATSALVLSIVLVLISLAGRAVRAVFDRMLHRALRAQDESLRAHAERAEELTALSAEIAHELKNPLASVKGLAGLLAESTPPGKASERLGVLRREIARMQDILDEFLNFSRPLVPLALGRVDLQALAREVAAMHEGLAREHGARIEVGGQPVEARCDPRKVKQVLINLVQNALEASGGDLAMEVASGPDGEARVSVLDRGRGVDPWLAGRVFDAGITTKPQGSGLGLTIARALARQHGGDLELHARAGGGSEAVLRLPGAAPHPEDPAPAAGKLEAS